MRAPPTPLTILSIAASALVGVAAGVGGYTFIYAKGFSYLTDEPAACNNCHAMNDHYGAWLKGSHHAVAPCNDCNTPHGFPAKYVAKAINGYRHSLAFTTGGFPDQIQATERNRKVTEAQCRHCHAQLVGQMEAKVPGGEPLSCLRCHETVGHLD